MNGFHDDVDECEPGRPHGLMIAYVNLKRNDVECFLSYWIGNTAQTSTA